MIRLSQKTMIILSGAVWLAVGSWLLPLGLKFLVDAKNPEVYSPFLNWLAPMLGGIDNGVVALIALAMLVGYFKGQKVLGKSAMKSSQRIRGLSDPAPITQLYTVQYGLLLAGMILLGMSIKWFGVPLDIRGFIDTAVGAALINGAMVYFREALFVVRGAACHLEGAKDLLKKD